MNKIFYQKIGNSRTAMLEFLTNHFRYWTMNPWNKSTSYANKVKIWNVIPKELHDVAFAIMNQGDVYDEINCLIEEFNEQHAWEWQVGFNGRSSGYLVLYQGGKRENGYKTRCDSCGKLTWYEEEQSCHVQECKGTLRKLTVPHYQIYTYPGKAVDEEKNYEDWDIDSLKDRVRLIREFDKLCDTVVATFIYYCQNYRVEEKEIMVPKTVKVLEAIPT